MTSMLVSAFESVEEIIRTRPDENPYSHQVVSPRFRQVVSPR